MKITERLLTIAQMVNRGDRVADIGSDHAYLAIHLIKQGISPMVIASDLNAGPLANAQSAIAQHGLKARISTRLGGGLSPYLQGEVDAYVIAGMGGHLITDILNTAPALSQSAKYLILQPMQNRPELRRWLHQNGYCIVAERIAIEGCKYYEIIKATAQKAPALNWLQAEIGINSRVDQHYLSFLKYKIAQRRQILKQVAGKGAKAEQLERQIKQLEEVYQCALTPEK